LLITIIFTKPSCYIMKQQSNSIVTLALLLAAGGMNFKASAQNAVDNFPMPKTVASGTKVQLDGSSSLQAVNQNLKDKFQKQFPGTDVTVPTQYQGSDAGVKAVEEGKADLAGIGRVLTKEEKAQGLAAKTIGRAKIAIIVKNDNPYTGNLSLKDFAKIYRGEVTDWSQLKSAKGAKGKIKVIDRPDTSDTKRAFANYPDFQNGKLKTGSNAEKLTEDTTQAVVDKLGSDGIGYAPADQIKNIPGIRAVTLHSTQPDNPKYPFSQPLVYAYKNKGGQVSEGAKDFLGYLGDPAGKTAITESIAAGAATAAVEAATTASPSAAPVAAQGTESPAPTGAEVGTNPTTAGTSTTSTTTTTTAGKGGFPWWILAIPILGAGLLWLFGRKKPEETVAPVVTPDTTGGLRPLYPPPPSRTSAGDGLSGDLSGDLSSGLGGFRPSGDLRSGDLRSGDLSSTLPPPPNFTPPTPPTNPSFNGTVETGTTGSGGINIPGAAALAGGAAAAAAAGKAIYDRTNQPEVKTPDIDLSNPLEGLKDKSSNLVPNLDLQNPLEGIKDKAGDLKDRAGDLLQDGTGTAVAASAGALAGGAALAGGIGNKIGNLFGGEQNEDLTIETPEIGNPIEEIENKAGDLTPNLPTNPLESIQDRAGDFIQGGGAAAGAAGAAALAGGAAVAGGVGNLFGDRSIVDEDRSDELWLETPGSNTPIDRAAIDDPFNPTDLPEPERAIDLDFDNPFGEVTDRASDMFQGGTAAAGAAGAAALAGGAAMFGNKQPEVPADFEPPNPELDTFDRDLEAIDLEGLDDDPFAGLSDLLGEETGEVKNEDYPKPDSSNPLAGFKDKATDLLEGGKGLGGAALAGGAAAAVGAGQAMQSFFQAKDTSNREDRSGNLYSEGQITLVSPSPTQAYAHWEIPVRLKRQLREQGGQKLVVRLYDVTDRDDPTMQLPSTFQEFECDDLAWDLEIPINYSNRRYLAEIGYITGDGRWLMLARSTPLMIPSA
jgi:ABC-type phosphate transport system substrate-binding protein